MSQTQAPSILDRFLDSAGDSMPLEYARKLVELRANPDDQARIDELADKCNEGLLTDDERQEYDDYLQAIHVLGILQRKAQRVIANGAHP
jgi:hypothetical protein